MSAEKFYGRILLVVVPILVVNWMVREAIHQWGVEPTAKAISAMAAISVTAALAEGIRKGME